MKKLFILLLILVFANRSKAQNATITLWPGQVPGEKDSKHNAVLRDSLQHITRITDITDPLMVVFKPTAAVNLHVDVIISPGGGNKYLAVDLEGYEIARWLNTLGYTAYVLQYRVPNKQTGALQDIQRAVRIVKNGMHGDKVGVMGFSAGGNLSARAMTSFMQKTYEPIDQTDSLSSRPDFSLLIYPGSLSTGTDHKLIPEIAVTKDTPSTFIFVAADDQFGPPLSLAYALRDNKIPYELHVYPKGGHGYGLRKGNLAAETWPALAAKWLSDYVIETRKNK